MRRLETALKPGQDFLARNNFRGGSLTLINASKSSALPWLSETDRTIESNEDVGSRLSNRRPRFDITRSW